MIDLYRVTVKKPSAGYSPYFAPDTSGELRIMFEREPEAVAYYEYYKNLEENVTFEVIAQNGQS
jgi:hypothetical protein